MFQVLLIDDEPLIREGLREVINWESYGFTVCDLGVDGRDGLNKIRLYDPTLVLVDIRMPGMSGIELIQQAKQEGYKCKFIILSGYSSFTYAKESIKLGIESYLLKPIDEAELILIVDQVKTSLSKERKIAAQLSQYQQLSEEEKWKAVIEGRTDDVSNLIEVNADHFHLAALQAEGNMKRQELKAILKPFETNNLKLIWKDHTIYLFCIGREEKQITKMLTLFRDEIQPFSNDPVKCYLAESFQTIDQVNLALQQIEKLANLGYCYREDSILTYAVFEKASVDDVQLDQLGSLIVHCLEFRDKKKLNEQMKLLIDYYQTVQFDKGRIQAEMIEFISYIYEILTKTYQDLQVGEKDVVVNLFYQTKSIQELFETMEAKLWTIAKQINGFTISTEDNMPKILSYIEQYYYQELNLKVLANLFNYNSSYLGKKFKNYTGEHFHTYLDKVRIGKAKQLLLKKNFRVYKVSELVGYSNMDYFYKKFKKHVGMSPKEYQKESRKEYFISSSK